MATSKTIASKAPSDGLQTVRFTPDAARRVRDCIARGRPFALPTETVYGLAGDATNDAAVAAIFAAKGRPSNNPLIVHVNSKHEAAELVALGQTGRALADAFWPGPLTIVAPARAHNGIVARVTAGLATLAVRVPGHPTARAVIAAAGVPLAAPSGNRSGRISPTTAAHVAAELGDRIGLIIDGGACDVGVESTIVQVDGTAPVRVLRHGGVTVEALARVVTLVPEGTATRSTGDVASRRAVTAPGQFASHYAPALPVRLNAARAGSDECLLAFGPLVGDPPVHGWYQLSELGDLREAASRLFAGLRTLDAAAQRPANQATGTQTIGAAENGALPSGKAAQGARRIAVAPIPATGLGLAINDRLARAAAPRSQLPFASNGSFLDTP